MNVALLNGKDLCGAPLWRACSYIVSVPNESIDGRVELDLTAFQTLQGNEVTNNNAHCRVVSCHKHDMTSS